ncbi:MAG: hypothetical protein KJ069_18440 [Anaerolineae bacterium]|nr:hypothetical protein [Anaerolineae bacterium]
MTTIIAIHPSGFEVHVEVELPELHKTICLLEQRGYRPSRELVYTAEGLPVCPRHGVPMQKREKQGDLWYSHKITNPQTGEVVYCRGYTSPSSPGFDIPAGNKHDGQTVKTESETAPTTGEGGRNGRMTHTPAKPAMDIDALNELLFG